MALKLKQDKTWVDDYGNTYTNSLYGVIDECNNNKQRGSCHLVFEVYISQQARQDKKQPIKQDIYDVSGEDWETYFSVEGLANYQDVFEAAYAYLKAHETNRGTEEEPDMILTYADWIDN